MSYDDYDDEAPVSHVAIGAELHLTTPELDLNASVGGERLADLISRQALRKLAMGDQWTGLATRVESITNEEIRAHVMGLIADALNGDLRRTNTYGEPYGEPTTLRSLIAEEAKTTLTRVANNGYRGETVLGKLIREEVTAAFTTELSAAIAEERTKVVAAVRKQAAQIIAEAVTKGIGQ